MRASPREYEHVSPTVHRAEYAPLGADVFFPAGEPVAPDALCFTYGMTCRLGQAEVAVGWDPRSRRDAPRVDTEYAEWQSPIVTLEVCYVLTTTSEKEDAESLSNARVAIAGKEEVLFALGDAKSGVSGVTNAPGVAILGQVSGRPWVLQYLEAVRSGRTLPFTRAVRGDLASMKQAIVARTCALYSPTDCLLPSNLWALLCVVRTQSGRTLLRTIEKDLQVKVHPWAILQNAGEKEGSTLAVLGPDSAPQFTRIVMFTKRADVVQLIRAKPFTQGPRAVCGLSYEVTCHSRIGGAVVKQPLAVAVMDGC